MTATLPSLANRSPPALIEPEHHQRFVISAVVGGAAGAAAGFYIAAQAGGTNCALSTDNQCTDGSHFFAYTAVGAVLGALMGIVVGGSD